MEIDQLRAFVSLARTRNFSKTAELLHLVQSTISVRIRALEEHLGKPLFERSHRHVDLTPAGHAFLPYAERVLSLCDEGTGEVRALSAFEGRLGVGATDSVWRYLMRPVLTDYVRRYPRVSVYTKTARSSQIVQMVADGLIDIGFAYAKPRLTGLASFRVYSDSVILVAPAAHPSTRSKGITREALPALPFLYCDWDGPIREWIQGLLPHGYLSPLYPDQLSILVTLLIEGCGAGFVPRFAIREELRRGVLKELAVARDLSPPDRIVFGIVKKGGRDARVDEWLTVMKAHGFLA